MKKQLFVQSNLGQEGSNLLRSQVEASVKALHLSSGDDVNSEKGRINTCGNV